MTADDLKRLDDLAVKTNDLRAELNRLRNASLVSAVNYSGTGGNGGTGDPVSKAAVSMADIEKQIKCAEIEMNEIIDTIPSWKTRSIFRRRYVYRQTWSQIADALGYLNDEGPKKRMNRFKNRVQKAA